MSRIKNKLIYILALIAFLPLSLLGNPANDIYLLPKPVKVDYSKGTLMIRDLEIDFSTIETEQMFFFCDELVNFIKERSGIEIKKGNSGKIQIQWALESKEYKLTGLDEAIGPKSNEAYKISIKPNGIYIKANTPSGFYYAAQTLRQLVIGKGAKSYFPLVQIEDFPAMPYRGYMTDVSHGGLQNIQEIKKQIDFLARFKTNQYYFYAENSIELGKYPLVNQKAKYSKNEIRELIEYANRRNIDFIPIINLYAHQQNFLRIEKYADMGMVEYCPELNPSHPDLDELMINWIEEYTELFNSIFFHIGFDEIWEGEWLIDKGLDVDVKGLYLQQLYRVTSLLNKKGKTVLYWPDMLAEYPELAKEVPKQNIAVAWDYGTDSDNMENFWIKPLKESNIPFFIQTAVTNWYTIYPAQRGYQNVEMFINVGKNNGTKGFINSMWHNHQQNTPRGSLPYIAHGSITAWQSEPLANYNFFLSSLSKQIYSDQYLSDCLYNAWIHLQESRDYIEKAFGNKRTLNYLWTNPFRKNYIEFLKQNKGFLKQSRIEAENAEEYLLKIYEVVPDDTTLNALIYSARMLNYFGMKCLMSVAMVDRWNYWAGKKNVDLWSLNEYMVYTPGSKVQILMDYLGELRDDFEKAYLNEYTPFRFNATVSRFDLELLFWREFQLRFFHYEGFDYDKNKIHPDFYEYFCKDIN